MANYKNKKGATGKKYTTYGDRIKVTYTDGSTRVHTLIISCLLLFLGLVLFISCLLLLPFPLCLLHSQLLLLVLLVMWLLA